MGTRSNIIVQHASGLVSMIYCHWDGYLDHNGRILQQHYNSQELADELVALGDLSSLGASVGEKHDFDFTGKMTDSTGDLTPEYRAYQKLRMEMCTAYHRDRGENWEDVKPTVFDNTFEAWPEPDTWAEFVYVWNYERQCWFVAGAHEGTQALVPLEYALAHPESVDANVVVPFLGVIGKHHPKAGLNS